jgi:hypothetical protein
MDKVRIRLGGPAKIGGKVHPGGAEIEVDPALAAELAAFGLVEAAPAAPARDERLMTQAEFETAVAATAKVLAESMLEAVTAEAIQPLEDRAVRAEAERDAALARVAEMQAVLAAATDDKPPEDTPPSATAAKTTRKGAAATKG